MKLSWFCLIIIITIIIMNPTKEEEGPWWASPLDKPQTPNRSIAEFLSWSVLSPSSSQNHQMCHHHDYQNHHDHTETISPMGLPLARFPRMAKTTTPAKTEVKELQIPTMKASLGMKTENQSVFMYVQEWWFSRIIIKTCGSCCWSCCSWKEPTGRRTWGLIMIIGDHHDNDRDDYYCDYKWQDANTQ